jgi:hypothetical protein
MTAKSYHQLEIIPGTITVVSLQIEAPSWANIGI